MSNIQIFQDTDMTYPNQEIELSGQMDVYNIDISNTAVENNSNDFSDTDMGDIETITQQSIPATKLDILLAIAYIEMNMSRDSFMETCEDNSNDMRAFDEMFEYKGYIDIVYLWSLDLSDETKDRIIANFPMYVTGIGNVNCHEVDRLMWNLMKLDDYSDEQMTKLLDIHLPTEWRSGQTDPYTGKQFKHNYFVHRRHNSSIQSIGTFVLLNNSTQSMFANMVNSM